MLLKLKNKKRKEKKNINRCPRCNYTLEKPHLTTCPRCMERLSPAYGCTGCGHCGSR